MYTPKHFLNDNDTALKQVVADNGFATLVSNDHDAGVPMITHLPLQLSGDRLFGHMARPNPHWKTFDGTLKATAIFHGPHAYISPTWYESDGLVPTWNYITVHVSGTMRAIDDLDTLKHILNDLSRQYEGSGPGAWSPDVLDEKKLYAMARGIIAFEMTNLEWVGKFKLGQNKSQQDQNTVQFNHRANKREDDTALANWMDKLSS